MNRWYRIRGSSLIAFFALATSLCWQGPAQTKHLDRANLDTTRGAADDLYQPANAGWRKRAPNHATYPQ